MLNSIQIFSTRCGALALGTLIACALLAGCGGGNSNHPDTAKTAGFTAPPSEKAADPAIERLVPESYRGKTLSVGTTIGLAPFEFYEKSNAENGELTGIDADLTRAVAARMGLGVSFTDARFDEIVTGVQEGRYDLGVAAIYDTLERQTQVDFVTYMKAGGQFYAPSGQANITSIAQACGRNAVALAGSVYQALFESQATQCPSSATLNLALVDDPESAKMALESGKADLSAIDAPIASWAVRNSGGKLALSGEPFDIRPYGMAIAKWSGLGGPIRAALEQLIADGTYARILKRWGLGAGAIKQPEINAASQ